MCHRKGACVKLMACTQTVTGVSFMQKAPTHGLVLLHTPLVSHHTSKTGCNIHT